MVVVQLIDILEGVYHCERDERKLLAQVWHDEPLDGLVLTILSQNTNDKNRDAAFANLKSKWGKWSEVANLSSGELAVLVRTAGLSGIKSERIIFILKKIKNDFGDYSLKKLREKDKDFVHDYLISLPGVGEKTVSCVMLFDLALPAFPVDTHIARVCNRLGFPKKIIEFMKKNVPEERYLGAHVNIIEFGRNICKAQKPKCGLCPLAKECPIGEINEK